MLKSLPDIPKPDWVPKKGPIDWQAYDNWIYGEHNCIYADYGQQRKDGSKYDPITMVRCFVCEIFYRGPCGFHDIVLKYRGEDRKLMKRPLYWICLKCREKPERPEE